MASSGNSPSASDTPAKLLAEATTRAAKRLSISQEELGEIIGISKSAVSRAASGGSLPEDGKAAELAALFVRMFRALDAIVGGDENVAAKWVRNHNTALGGEPLVIMKSLPGLVDCLAYLDARRALF